ncbi:UPF0149 family protein [uncultured Ferrimonas sp.]|uniref:UPF0149 family protein n=1 Tax=uncultured Ferrimonas sp. TaxID=432640 RepID=UPI002609D403|nr:UPF0149 family protein [uncultured Ferrimonas sp.]
MKNKLSKSEQQRLIHVLDDAAQHGGLNFWQSQGFLTHLHCYPKSLDPSGWSCAIAAMAPSKSHWPFDEKEMDLLFVLFNQLHQQLHEKQQLLPTALDEAIELLAQRQLTQPLRNWCAGFVYGFRFLQEQWQQHLNEEALQDLDECVAFIGYLATLGSDEPHALAWRNATKEVADAANSDEPQPTPAQLLATFEQALTYCWQQQANGQ